MQRLTSARFHALAGLLLCGLLASCRSSGNLQAKQREVLKSYRAHVTETVPDPRRARELILLGEALDARLREDIEMLDGLANDLGKLNRGYGTTREQLAEKLDAINRHRGAMREHVLEARAKAVSLTSAEEWQALMKRDKTLMGLVQDAPGLL